LTGLYLLFIFQKGSYKIHFGTEDFPQFFKEPPVAQAFQPVRARAFACGDILPEPIKVFKFVYLP
jgi:hypothetical protein